MPVISGFGALEKLPGESVTDKIERRVLAGPWPQEVLRTGDIVEVADRCRDGACCYSPETGKAAHPRSRSLDAPAARPPVAEQRPCQSHQLHPQPLGRLTRFLDDGRICLSNNAAERALRGVAVGRKNWTFAGSDAGGYRAAAVYTLIETCKLNDVDPQAWLTDVLARLPDYPASRITELLLWNWKAARLARAA
jgi:hypothetical protein